MKKDTKKVVEVVEVVVEDLSVGQVENLDHIVSAIESVIDMDNIYNKDRASLVVHAVKLVAEVLGTEPTYKLWGLVHDYIQSAICKARGMSDEGFNNHIWTMITKRLESEYALVKPSSANPESVKKQAMRKAKQAEMDKLTDKQLEEKGFLVELAKRKEKRILNAENLEKKAKKDFSDTFIEKFKSIAKNEFDFAMYLDKQLASIRADFEKSKS